MGNPQTIPMNVTESKTTHDHCINVCNGLLRGEISAVETYGQALTKYAGTSAASTLARIRDEHIRAVECLTANVQKMGGEPAADAGAWGMFASLVQGTANLFGPGSAIESLQKGEDVGRNDYQVALADPQVMTECKAMIREELLPQVMNHIATLEGLEETV
jgi:hypothetical protein